MHDKGFRNPLLLLFASALLTFSTLVHSITVEFTGESDSRLSDATQALIREIAEATEVEVRQLLPGLPEEILLSVSVSRNVIPELGVGASSLAPGHIAFVVNADHPEGAEALVRASLRSTLFHEMHHLARGFVISRGDTFTSFMDAVVGEGMATVFEREFAGSDPLWGQYPDDVQEWADELIALPLSAYQAYAAWMFMHPDGRRWIGYRTGTYIVDQAEAKSGLTSADMVTMPTQDVLDLFEQ